MPLDLLQDADGALLVFEARHCLHDFADEDAVIGEKEVDQDEHQHRADEKLRRAVEHVRDAVLFHFDRLCAVGWCGRRSQILNRAARLRDLLHRLLEREKFLLELLQTVRRFLQPTRSRCGEE